MTERTSSNKLGATSPIAPRHDPECPQYTLEPRDPARCICESLRRADRE